MMDGEISETRSTSSTARTPSSYRKERLMNYLSGLKKDTAEKAISHCSSQLAVLSTLLENTRKQIQDFKVVDIDKSMQCRSKKIPDPKACTDSRSAGSI